MKRTVKRFICSLIGFSLIISAAGCSGRPSETTSTAAAETTAESVKATEGTTANAENQSFTYRPGDVVTFGKYEQDNNQSNGKEDIEWIVLARDGNKLLLISRSAIEQMPYNEKSADVTWETCSLRNWLNGSFYESAFDEEDKGYIVNTNVTADKNPEYGTKPGNDTKDNVFLLSISEFEKYFASVKGIMCEGTEYARSKETNNPAQYFIWWLRTPGKSQDYASQVVYYGANGNPVANGGVSVDCTKGCSPDEHCGGVRPVMWVELPGKYTTQNKHLTAWVMGYGTARINYDSNGGEKTSDISVPCQILYVDGSPSTAGEVRTTYGTNEAIEEWLKNNVGDNVGYGWEGEGSMLVAGSGRLEKTG